MPEPRSAAQRKADTLAKLAAPDSDCWVATASSAGKEFLVPLSYAWDGRHVVIGTVASFVTARNILASGRARLGFGPTRDVVLIDVVLAASGTADEVPKAAEDYARQADWDPREEPDPYLYLLLRPVAIQAWREANELDGKWLMRDGEWLT